MSRNNNRGRGEARESASRINGTIRCAIDTRKSTDEGLEQEFNRIDAQRESAEAYIASQRHEGWVCIPDRFDDGGFTGGNMERPPSSGSSLASSRATSTAWWFTKWIV